MSPGRRRSLRDRLVEAEATLDAIRKGEVDAVIVSGSAGERTLVFDGAARPYHLLLNAMHDGAALLDLEGTILFANRSLESMAGARNGARRGSPFRGLVGPAGRAGIDRLVRDRSERSRSHEFTLAEGRPVLITVSSMSLATGSDAPTVLMAIITDLTDRKRAEAARHRLLERLIAAEEEERRRIARDLHDEVGQSLTALLLGLRTLRDAPHLDEARSATAALRAVVAETLDNIGQLARGLHPRELDQVGLVVAAARQAERLGRSSGIEVEFREDGVGADRLPLPVETTLYRAMQEALTNVVRHAGATRVAVGLTRTGDIVELVVQDNGAGFDTDAARPRRESLGLHGMQERVAMLGGVVEVQSEPRRGTVVRVRIPVARA